ncbi:MULTISPECIES: hypothetical protein [Streptomyces]|uniref:hypothetical protein n=1 Tax=Streptomyces TaxID=1883 RepID=UPI0034603DA5
MAGVDLNAIGIAIVVTFHVTWIGAVVLWEVRCYDERYAKKPVGDPEPAGF